MERPATARCSRVAVERGPEVFEQSVEIGRDRSSPTNTNDRAPCGVSSVGQSARFRIGRSEVRVLDAAPARALHAVLVQSDRTPDCESGGPRFESSIPHQSAPARWRSLRWIEHPTPRRHTSSCPAALAQMDRAPRLRIGRSEVRALDAALTCSCLPSCARTNTGTDSPIGRGTWSRATLLRVRLPLRPSPRLGSPMGRGGRFRSGLLGVRLPPQAPLTPHSSLLTPHSSLLTPHSSLLTPHSSLLTPRLGSPIW